ncbi:acyl-CoA thioesterase [Catenuloplanes nepalensis]|nr:acyl-CoA thioesterase [Catenuloplanes nepalensis]
MMIDWLWATRRGPKTPAFGLHDTARTSFRVRPSDLDMARHMNNSRYLAYMDLGRFDLLRRSGALDVLKPRGWYPIVAAQTISFRRSLLPGARFLLETTILGYDDRAVYVEQRFRSGDDTAAVGIVAARIMKRSGGPVPLLEVAAALNVDISDRPAPQWVLDWAARSRATVS